MPVIIALLVRPPSTQAAYAQLDFIAWRDMTNMLALPENIAKPDPQTQTEQEIAQQDILVLLVLAQWTKAAFAPLVTTVKQANLLLFVRAENIVKPDLSTQTVQVIVPTEIIVLRDLLLSMKQAPALLECIVLLV